MRRPPSRAASPAIVLFAHGARDPRWAQPLRKIQRAIIRKKPGTAVELAFLEIMEPPLADAIAKLVAAGHKRITVAPLFMAQVGHLKRDLPKILDAIRAEHRGAEITLLPAIGDVDAVLEAISDWLVSAMLR
ncbi:MAG: CbiX/SirB N-terminal domain-containing protein [Betaproteobacteria bacterium]|nr:CbiX/SirB N-terminal domain-containing protein [Betaproteobacteria bacterium]MBI2291016.1 CbiX/SirB N-terminal domain-containing protein [Betaproteobacteria bacterium]MBI3054771.1 CbiX/SirB N-terminal domain-containing protein [Betaproteobacteria bacterium]